MEQCCSSSRKTIKEVTITLHSDEGKNRLVYRVIVDYDEESEGSSVFIMKISRWSLSKDTARQAALTKITNEKLGGRGFGFLGQLSDGRMVVAGPFYEGNTLQDWARTYDNEKYFTASVAESVRIWRDLDGFFTPDAHRGQFIIVNDTVSHQNPKAELIDKGDFRVAKDVEISFLNEPGGNLQPFSEEVDLYDYGQWLVPVSELDLLTYLERELSDDGPIVSTDPDTEMLDMMGDSRSPQFNMRSMVDGIIQALGRDGAIEFFKQVNSDPQKNNFKRWFEFRPLLTRQLPEVYEDKAMLGSSPLNQSNRIDKYGGIDFNPRNINLIEQGQEMRINFSTFLNTQRINPQAIDGVLPVIINITPLPSALPLIGIKQINRENEFGKLSLN